MSQPISNLFLPALPTGSALRPYDRDLNIKLRKWSDEVTAGLNGDGGSGGSGTAFAERGSDAVPPSADTLTISLTTTAPDANYFIGATPNWNTTFWVGAQTTGGFTLYFNTPAPPTGGGVILWSVSE